MGDNAKDSLIALGSLVGLKAMTVLDLQIYTEIFFQVLIGTLTATYFVFKILKVRKEK